MVGEAIDLVTIVQKINKIANRKSPIKISLKGLDNEYTCNNRRLINEMGDFKFMDFDKSLAELYSWYQDQKFKLRKKDFLADYF